MSIITGLFLLITVSGLFFQTNGYELKRFCYFTNWSNKLASFDARFEIRDINVTLCTHLIYAFANIDVTNMKLIPSEVDDDNGKLVNKKGRYFDFNKLKIEHPELVTLLSVGGASAKNGGFTGVVQTIESMKLFSRNMATYLRDRDFNGIDIDWEWPDDIYRNKYTTLLKTMREEFDKEALRTSKPRLLITIAVAVGEETITKSYNITEISRYVDYIQIMAYDFHGPWSDVTSFSAPLFSRASNPRFNQQLSQAWAVDRWISGGAPRNKLVLGLTGSATSFKLANRTATAVGSPVLGPGQAGPYLGREGHVTYYRVCEMIRNGAIHRWDDEQKMGYAYMEDQWAGYGNERSMKEKIKFAYSRNIGGVMFWSMDQDDFLGHYCNAGEFPLLTAVYNAIKELAPHNKQVVIDVSTSTTQSTTPIDFRLHHKTNKNGINFFQMQDNGSGYELKRFCYFTNWSNKLASFDARFDIRDINVTLCTHLIYAFAEIDVENRRLIHSQVDDDNGQLFNKKGRYFDFNKLKIEHPELVTLLSVGGASAEISGFLQIVQTVETMKLFSRNVAIYLRDRDFNGIDIDWEWPDNIYRKKYITLLKTMREEFDKEAMRTSKPRLLITIAVAVGEDTITKSYNITEISRYVDYIQIMAYDFHGPWSDVTSFSAPLYSRGSNPRFNQQLSQAWAVDRWISGGAPRNKLVLGLTGSAITFKLANRTTTAVGSPVLGPGQAGPYLGLTGHVTYYRVCEMIRNGAIHRWDDEQKMGYAYMEDQWVGYGNERSMKEKVKFAYSRYIAGVMFWSMDQDDFLGNYCNAGKFPLLTAIYNAIKELAPSKNHEVIDVSTSTIQSTSPIDFRLHNKIKKKGSNCFQMQDNGSASFTFSFCFLLLNTFIFYIVM